MKLRSWRGSSPGVIGRRLNFVGLQDRPRDGGSSAGAPENFSIVQSGVLVGNTSGSMIRRCVNPRMLQPGPISA